MRYLIKLSTFWVLPNSRYGLTISLFCYFSAPHDSYGASDRVCLQAPREGIHLLCLRTGEQSVRTRLSGPVLLGLHYSIDILYNDLEFIISLTCVAFIYRTMLKMFCLLSFMNALSNYHLFTKHSLEKCKFVQMKTTTENNNVSIRICSVV